MISSYSRNPNLLFLTQDTYVKKQSRYKNVTLKVSISEHLPANTEIYEAVVDWYNTTIKVFIDSDDALNNVPCFEGQFFIPCTPQPAEVYVSETFQYLARGHSIHHPLCTCSLRFYSRVEELGLSRESCCCCPLETNGQRKSVNEIAKELGVLDLNGCVEVSPRLKMPLIKVFTKLASLRFSNPHFISSPLCCIPVEVHSAADILAAAKAMYPRPYMLDCRNGSCENKSLMEDLEFLKNQSLVRVVGGLFPLTYSVFYYDMTKEEGLDGAVDQIFRDYWHNQPQDFLKGPSQIDVERMLLTENIKPMEVAKVSPYIPPFKRQKKCTRKVKRYKH